MMRIVLPLLLLASAASVYAQGTATDQGKCELEFESGTGNTRTTLNKLESGKYNVFQGGGVTYHCKGQGNTLVADSAEYYGDPGILYMIGSVHYIEPRVKVNSDRMTYFQFEDQLHAEGNVRAVMKNGSTLDGPSADYYRAVPGKRAAARLVAPDRPRMAVVQPDSANPAHTPEPTNIVANTIISENDSLVYASGKVEITRTDLRATSDSAFMDSGTEFARLVGHPVVSGTRGRPFTLYGEFVDIYSKNRSINRVVATPNGRAISEDTELSSDSIDIRIENSQISRVMAWGPSRAHAKSPDRDIVADSIDAVMPGQVFKELRAIGRAFANSTADTAKIITKDHDWMAGDSIFAAFDTLAKGDTSKKPNIKEINAIGSAKSFYHIANQNKVKDKPSVNYARGDKITVLFKNRAAEQVIVKNQAVGVYLEPAGVVKDTTATKNNDKISNP